MTRLPIAFLALATIGCTTPKAIVIEQPPGRSRALARNATEAPLPGPESGLRDPDVLSDLPEDKGLRSSAAVTSTASGDGPTVIARPPSEPATDTPPPSDTN